MLIDFNCPKCGGSIYENHGLQSRSFWVRLGYWHYLINPGLAFNELVFGQRLPRTMCVCKACELPLHHRAFVPCPGCGALHGLEIQKKFFAFGNYFGLFCPLCQKEIPSLSNFTSSLIKLVTRPLYMIPAKPLKRLWLERRRKLAEAEGIKLLAMNSAEKEQGRFAYLKMGVLWGAIMFFVFWIPLLMGFFAGNLDISFFIMVSMMNLVLWMAGGLAFGGSMMFFLERRGNKELHLDMKELTARMNQDDERDGDIKELP